MQQSRAPRRAFVFLKETGSTNTDLKDRIRETGDPVFEVIAADRQTSGRGRLGRTFFSPTGGVYFSASYPLTGREKNPAFLSLLAGLAAAAALEKLCGAKPLLKWPNDLILREKKLAGILTEYVGERRTAVVGIGVNLRRDAALPPALRETAISLEAAGFAPPDPAALVRETVAALDRAVYLESGLEKEDAAVTAALNRLSYLNGRRVTRVGADGETVTGTALEIAPDGALLLRTDGGDLRRITCGELTPERPRTPNS